MPENKNSKDYKLFLYPKEDGYILQTCHFIKGEKFYMDYWTGYIILPKGHKLENIHYDEILHDIHGGFTYSEWENHNGERRYVIGFDTAHYGDKPETTQNEKFVLGELERVYKEIVMNNTVEKVYT